jgi:hypothetical protein
MIRPGYRPGTERDDYFRTEPGSTHRNGMPVKAYEYRGSGHDMLTPVPDLPPRPAAAASSPDGPAPVVLPQYGRLLALCPYCAGGDCFACLEGPCRCACQDGVS